MFNFDTFEIVNEQIPSSSLLYAMVWKKSEMWKNLLKFNFDTFWGVYDQIVSSPLLYAIQRKKKNRSLKKPQEV